MKNTDSQQGEKKKCGQSNTFMIYGMILGSGVGTAFGVAFDNIPIGVAIGPGIGMVLGMLYDQRRRKNPEDSNLQQVLNKNCSNPGSLAVLGMILGAGVGTAFGVAFDNIPIGLTFGPGLGLVAGMLLERSRRKSSKDSA